MCRCNFVTVKSNLSHIFSVLNRGMCKQLIFFLQIKNVPAELLSNWSESTHTALISKHKHDLGTLWHEWALDYKY